MTTEGSERKDDPSVFIQACKGLIRIQDSRILYLVLGICFFIIFDTEYLEIVKTVIKQISAVKPVHS